ncbi:hypothetical protein HUE56_15115 [Azospirillum oryzae]|uniref:Uncharacterized protein n=1 Tax=Azospirillum oryzae TaxID=286727 RepID=A0A6N1AKB0_9PROT|nr:hypothetical protein [Azospirillum oryzae]KAA0589940.1 hypothetical protein FZ938_10115 [Azospirillum oryzae]QKS51779.1 hypothetical protein HUE56_15115 [Azospirillum oryzae]GLR81406.1 hypothetical protein GCM10007856_40920 [Azospirillum oryzae]
MVALSKEWFDYHLTPAGWHHGTERLDGGTINEEPVPDGCVLTVRVHEEIGSIGGKLHNWVAVHWQHADTALVKELLIRHGQLPPHSGIETATVDW